jgi:peptidoglycan/LPS O-acetylase OafA/YrhL
VNYRPEIDGLRAVAVIPVVLFHLCPTLVPGGFVGVDVFFVISGFLITSIILRETEAGTFTLRNFWMRRIRRLFPALAMLLLVVMGSGLFLLYEDEWRALGEQVMAVLILWANVFLREETGDYWGSAGESMALLHTWSLAVEEQFYLLFPLVMLGLLKLGKKWILPALLIGTLSSFGFGLWRLGSDPSAAFYLLPSRAWELFVGALLATWIWRRKTDLKSSWLAELGLITVLVSYWFIQGGADFPGWKALLPVLGTALVLAFGNSEKSVAGRMLSVSPLVFLGKISYSLYLWHWPIIVFWRFQTQEDVSELRYALPIAGLSVVAAVLSYYFIERPFRTPAFPL